MRKKVIQWILQRIVKNAERSAGLPSDHGLFEAPVPEKLMLEKLCFSVDDHVIAGARYRLFC